MRKALLSYALALPPATLLVALLDHAGVNPLRYATAGLCCVTAISVIIAAIQHYRRFFAAGPLSSRTATSIQHDLSVPSSIADTERNG